MTIKRDEILDYLAEFLATNSFEDYCINGLQVEGKETIERIITGVSANKRFFEMAVEVQADMIIVHHGLFWKSFAAPITLTGYMAERVKILMKNDINLCAYHLPLDAHQTLGNNHHLCEKLNIKERKPFDVGFIGTFPAPILFQDIVKQVKELIHPHPSVLNTGSEYITTMAVVSGGPGSKTLIDAAHLGAEAFLCGDIQEPTPALAEELGINYINAGHYNTEIFGIKSLGEHLAEKFSLDVQFINIPNPI